MQFVVNGVIAGSAIGLVAVALQCVYLPTRVLFVALAGVYSVAPFVASSVAQGGWGWPAAIAAAIFTSSAVSVICEVTNHAPLARKHASEGAHFISSLGIYLVLIQAITLIWGAETRTLRVGLENVTSIADVAITQSQWIMIGTATALLLIFAGLLAYSGIGLRLRALADNPTQFMLLDFNIDSYRLLAFGASGAFAAISSLLVAYDVGFDPYNGLQTVLLALVAVIVGGRDSFVGPVIAALFLGVLRAAVVWTLSPRWQEAITYLLLAVFLLLRPMGLIGRPSRVESVG